MKKKKKKSYVEIARLYGKNESSFCEVMKNKENNFIALSTLEDEAKTSESLTFISKKGKGKAFPLQARCGSECG